MIIGKTRTNQPVEETEDFEKRVDELLQENTFAGDIKVSYVVPNTIIDEDDLPSTSGLYRLVNDGKVQGVIALFMTKNPDVCYFSGNFNSLIFKGYQSVGDINIYNYSIEKMVQANPTLAGTETALTGLQVGDTKYKVSGGTKLYIHKLTLNDGTNTRSLKLVSTDSQPYTLSSLYANKEHIISGLNYVDVMYDNVFGQTTKYFDAYTFVPQSSGNSIIEYVMDNAGSSTHTYKKYEYTTLIEDIVTEL